MSEYKFNPQTGELSPKGSSSGNAGGGCGETIASLIGWIIIIILGIQMCG